MKRTIFFISIIVLITSCVSRLRRPEITGIIVDYSGKAITNCKVGEVFTDKNGRFILPEKRYNAFLLTQLFYMEAPPLFVHESIEKKGFEVVDYIKQFNRHGGGAGKGAKSNMDTIYLKKNNQEFDLDSLIQSDWNLSANKNWDTIHVISENFSDRCKTQKCDEYDMSYLKYTDNFYNTLGSKNLPDGIIRREISIGFRKNNTFEMKKID